MTLRQHILFVLAAIAMLGGCALQKESIGFSKPVMMANESMVVFFRQGGSANSIASAWVDDKIVGTLLPDRYAQSFVCPGKRSVRVEAHYGSNNQIISKVFAVEKGKVLYLQVSDASLSGHYEIHQVDSNSAVNVLKNLKSKSHIINRHLSCNLKYIELDADTLFAFGDSDLTPAGKTMLNDLAKNLHENVSIKKLRIEGFTDRLGSSTANDRLSLSRAKAVAVYLNSQNIVIPIETIGMGERSPVSKGCVGEKMTSELLKCLAPDRRVRIEIIGLSAQTTNK